MSKMSDSPRSRNHDVAESIKQFIIDQRLRPGDVLPTESELTAALGASRTSVREAIRALSALDIVDVRHGHGTYVGNLSMSALVESLAFRGLLSSGTDDRVMRDVVDLRQLMEQGLAPLMIDTLDALELMRLRELAIRMRRLALEGKPYVDEDRAFHMALMRTIGNDLIVQLTEAFWRVQARVAPTIDVPEADWIRTAEAHEAIVDAIEAKDVAQVRAAVEAHYEPLRTHITTLLEEAGARLR
ncbi:MAG: FadR family transcriptional regulator [Intrasporangium sp.]|uniref:FadR/GntR family transcriptional regulator n=1 Tax=Intrasporangium sp. TaxID=1925024 RepID=UPI0026491028|nr:FadR/GntR family transcriptional regulator [Intrasporangium sp.]MDN5797151.1 FadR family transcriptional regulator [Intrasporangium sp.]